MEITQCMIFFADTENFFSYADISQEELDNPTLSSFNRQAGSGQTGDRMLKACLHPAPQHRVASIISNEISILLADQFVPAAEPCHIWEMKNPNDRP